MPHIFQSKFVIHICHNIYITNSNYHPCHPKIIFLVLSKETPIISNMERGFWIHHPTQIMSGHTTSISACRSTDQVIITIRYTSPLIFFLVVLLILIFQTISLYVTNIVTIITFNVFFCVEVTITCTSIVCIPFLIVPFLNQGVLLSWRWCRFLQWLPFQLLWQQPCNHKV